MLITELSIRVLAPQRESWLDVYAPHPVLGWLGRPGYSAVVDTGESFWSVHIDEQGFRRGTKERAHDTALPIALWIGDSYTFGFGVEDEESFVSLIASRPDRRFETINAGMLAFGPEQYRRMLEIKLSQGLAPARVFVVTYLGNDFLDAITDRNVPIRDGILGAQNDIFTLLKRNTHTYRLISRLLHIHAPGDKITRALSLDKVAFWQEESMLTAKKIYQEQFEAIAAICSENNIELDVVLLPPPFYVEAVRAGDTPNAKIDASLPMKSAKEILDRAGVRTLDLTPVFAEHELRKVFYRFDDHLTKEGNRLAAEAILAARPELIGAQLSH